MEPACLTKFALARASMPRGVKPGAELGSWTLAAKHPVFFRALALMRRPGSTQPHTCRRQQTSQGSLPPAIVRTRSKPVCATPSVQPRDLWWTALVVPAAIAHPGWLAETTHTIDGTAECFVWNRVQSAAGSLRRFVSWIREFEVAIPYHIRVAIVKGHSG